MRAARHPPIVGLERQSKPVVGNAHIAVRAVRYRFGRHGPHLLRDHPDIGGVTAIVDETIIAETVVEPPEQYDVMLEANVGATPAAATPAAAAPAATEAAAAPAAAEAAAAPAAEAAVHSAAAERAAIGEGRVGPAHPHTAHGRASRPADVRPPSRTVGGPRRRAGAAAGSACTANSPWLAYTANSPWPACTANSPWPARTANPSGSARTANPSGTARATDATWPSRAAAPADPAWPPDAARPARSADAPRTPRPADAAGPPGSAGANGEIGADPRLAAHTGPIVPVRPPRLHVIADVAEVDVIADIDVAVIDAAIPARVASPSRRIDRAGSPIPVIVVPQRSNRDACPKTQERRNPCIGLVDCGGVIGRDIDRRRVGRLDGDIARRGLRRCRPLSRASPRRRAPLHAFDGLLIGRLKRPGRFRLGAKVLDDFGDVLRLVHFGVAEVRRPVEVGAHQLDDVRKARERLHRGIPILIVDAGIIVFGDERLVLIKPALRLDDLHGISACRQHLREQRVGIERDRGQ